MVGSPPHSPPTYSPSVPPDMPQTMNVKGLSVEDESKKNDERPKRRVRRYSANRLLREKVPVPAQSTLSTETHRGQMMVRVEQRVDR